MSIDHNLGSPSTNLSRPQVLETLLGSRITSQTHYGRIQYHFCQTRSLEIAVDQEAFSTAFCILLG